MIRKSIFVLLFILSSTITSLTAIKVIIWDIGGVLATTNKRAWISNIGIGNILAYMLCDRQNPKTMIRTMRSKFMEVIHAARGGKEHCVNKTVPDDQGNPLPDLMCEYQAGKISSETARKELLAVIELLDSSDYFISKREKRIITKAIMGAFTPDIFAQSMSTIHAMEKLVEQFAAIKDKDGNPYYEQIVLSNWDSESFEPFKQKNEKLFRHFKPENIFISGHIQQVKPHAVSTLLDTLAVTRNIQASDCILFDDQKVNAVTAQLRGAYAFTGNYQEIERQIKTSGLLSPQIHNKEHLLSV